MSVVASSNKVINYRLKNGQCIHCGIQTHDINKKGMFKKEKVPRHIPGVVEYGRCLQASCQKAGNQVAQVPNDGKSSSLLGSGAKTAVGTVANVAGVTMTVMGIPGGEVVSTIGSSIQNSGGGGKKGSGGVSAGFQALNQSNQHFTKLMQQQDQHFKQFQQKSEQDMAVASANLAKALKGLDQRPLSLTTAMSSSRSSAKVSCPNRHALVNSPLGFYCDICGSQGNVFLQLAGCRACNWDICTNCQNQAGAGDMTQTCPINHTLYHTKLVKTMLCDICWKECPAQQSYFYCKPCDFGACSNIACVTKGAECAQKGAIINCPNGHIANTPSPATNSCDLCGQAIGNGGVACRTCNWDVCQWCRIRAVIAAVQPAYCPKKHTLYRVVSRTNSFICDVCSNVTASWRPFYVCRICDWGTCYEGSCIQKQRVTS